MRRGCKYSWNAANNAHWVKGHLEVTGSFSLKLVESLKKAKEHQCENDNSLNTRDQYNFPHQKERKHLSQCILQIIG